MNPVKKWSILSCLVLTLAGAGVWLLNNSPAKEEASSGLTAEPSRNSEPEYQTYEQSEISEETTPKEVSRQSHLAAGRTAPNKKESRQPTSKRISDSQAESASDETSYESSDRTESMPSDDKQMGSTESISATPDHLQRPTESVDIEEPAQRSIWLSLGGGLSFSSLSQDVPGASELTVGKFSAPFLLVEIGAWLTKKLGLELSYQSLPGKVLSSPGLTVSKEDYTWKTMSAEVNYKINTSHDSSKEWIIKTGIQHQEIPFLHPQSPTVISLFENSLTTASIGMKYRRKLQQKIFFESLVRYRYPVSSTSVAGTRFSIQSPLLIDGDVGVTYGLSPHFSLGGYWSAQYLSYRYQFADFASAAENGKQTLIQSNLSLRLKWEF